MPAQISMYIQENLAEIDLRHVNFKIHTHYNAFEKLWICWVHGNDISLMHSAQILTVVQKAIITLIKLTMYLENERMYESKLHLYIPSCLVCKYAYMSICKYQNRNIYRELRIVMYVFGEFKS